MEPKALPLWPGANWDVSVNSLHEVVRDGNQLKWLQGHLGHRELGLQWFYRETLDSAAQKFSQAQ